MSSEGKKKRGESGQANAKANAFRINGWPMDWAARRIGATHVPRSASSGSTTMRGILGGILAAKLGFEFYDSPLYDHMVEHAQRRVTSSLLKE